MALPLTKQQKLQRLADAPAAVPPIPEWPKLPDFIRERNPDKAEEIEAYNNRCVEFFKKTGTIANQ